MRLESLQLINFKNYGGCSLTFSPGLNFIYGNNGNGKTNILEAISFLSYTKSFLQNIEADCIKYGENSFEVKGSFINNLDSRFRINLRYSSSGLNKEFTLNSEKVVKLNEILGLFPLVTLSPYDLKLTTGIPHERRRSFDLLISQISRVYLNDIRSFSRILKQKNAFLKDNLFSKRYSYVELSQMLELWNNELVNTGLRIAVRRLDFIENFKKLLAEGFRELVDSDYEPIIEIESDLFEGSNHNTDIDLIAENFRKNLEEKTALEIKRGVSLIGPHRDNYIFKFRKNKQVFDIRTFASQGEHKLFIVALKLAEFKYIRQYGEGSSKGAPVLILDDIFSELDKAKVERVCEILPQYNQLFITTTDNSYKDKLVNYFPSEKLKLFEIVNGEALYVN